MSGPFPASGQAVAIRDRSGQEAVIRVVEAAAPVMQVSHAPPLRVGDLVDGAFVDGDGAGHRLRARTLYQADDRAGLRLEFVTALRGRFLQRFTPSSPLLAELVAPSGVVSGRVVDLALTGLGVETAGVQVGASFTVRLTDTAGRAVVDGVTAQAVRVDDGIVGLAFARPYDAAPVIQALAATRS